MFTNCRAIGSYGVVLAAAVVVFSLLLGEDVKPVVVVLVLALLVGSY